MSIPILYSERNCPYSIRARMALKYAGIAYQHREVDSHALSADVIELSPDGRVPLLQVIARDVLNHSMDIMHWALLQNDPDGWLDYELDELEEMQGLVRINDSSFAQDVIRYVSWNEYGEKTRDVYRKDCELFLGGLEEHLQKTSFLFADRVSMADFAVFPFVRMFTEIKMEWFRAAMYPHVWKWLAYHEQSPLFKSVMQTHPLWHEGSMPARG